MDKFKSLISFAEKQQTTLGFGLLALLTAGGEQIFSTVVFKCPCSSWNFAYGGVFLFVPALVLLTLGYIISNKTWKLFTGLCKRKNNLWSLRCTCAFAQIFLQITITAIVAPVSWIAVALLNGNYFECALTGVNVTQFKDHLCEGKSSACSEELHLFPCGKSSVPVTERDAVLGAIRAQSQVLGWLVIACVTLLGLIATCLARCNSPVSYLQLKFWKAYASKECSLLEKYSTEHAEKLADRNLKSFFQHTPPEPLVTPDNMAWEKVSSLYSFSTKNQYYSILHKYVETSKDSSRHQSIRSEPGDLVTPAVLSFIDEGKAML